jgi:hypothetical protein
LVIGVVLVIVLGLARKAQLRKAAITGGVLKASEALAAHAADLLEKADTLEWENAPPAPQPPATLQQPSQQQPQVQPKKLDDSADC